MTDDEDIYGSHRFRGTGVALITPFKPDGSIDEDAIRRLVERQIEGGTDFLVPCGTTGENPALSFEEHVRVIELVIRASDGKVPVMAGAGSNSTDTAIAFAERSVDLGADALLTITPYYNKPGPEGLYRHFSAQWEAVEKTGTRCPLLLYNVPGRTGCNMTPSTLDRLQKIPGVIGVKEASGDLGQIQQILRDRPPGFLVLSGDDSLTLPIIALGGDGVISVVANEVPERFSRMVGAALRGDFDEARSVHFELLELMEINFIESNPAPAKAIMKMMGILESDALRSPLAPVTEQTRQKLEEVAGRAGLLGHGGNQ